MLIIEKNEKRDKTDLKNNTINKKNEQMKNK